MDISNDSLLLITFWSLLLFCAYYLLYYKFIYSVIDPLFSWIFATSFASYLAVQVIPTTQDVIHFFGCQLSLWFGFMIAYNVNNSSIKIVSATIQYEFYDHTLLRWTTYFLLSLYILSNIIIGYSKGFALLSSVPTEAKIANFQQGFGIFRKINWSAGTFVGIALIYMYVNKRRKTDLFFLIIVIIFSSLDGSKSALIKIAISAGFIFYHPAFSKEKLALKKFQQYMPLFFACAIALVFIVLLKENDGLNSAFIALVRRLLYSADSLLYYYQPVNVDFFEKYSPWDYVSVVTNPILGFLRLQPYHEAIGNIMVDNLRLPGSIASVTVGPNAPFYIEGRIYFYYWLAFPFSIIVGYLYASLRVYFFSINKSSAFYFVYMASFLHLAGALIGDVNLAITQSFDLAFFVIPPYILISFIFKHRLRVRITPKLGKIFKVLKAI